jgi:hypothetical protein
MTMKSNSGCGIRSVNSTVKRLIRVDEIANLAADGLLPIGQGIDVGVSTRVGSVGHAGSTVT